MAKGSGNTRGSSSGAPRGMASTFDTDINRIQKTAFKDMGGGVWELNSDNADAAIIKEYSPDLGNTYRINGLGARGSDGEYREASRSDIGREAYNRQFSTLNAAKAAAREELERYYRSVNR